MHYKTIATTIAAALLAAACGGPAKTADHQVRHIPIPDAGKYGIGIVVDPTHCRPTRAGQEGEMIALLCETANRDGYVGVVMNASEWAAMVQLKNYDDGKFCTDSGCDFVK